MKIKGKEIKGIIFDLDGTLIDSYSIWHEVDHDFFAKRNMELPSGYAEAIGHMGLDKAAIYTINEYHLNEKKEDIINEWKNAVLDKYAHHVFVKEYVKEFLDKAKEEGTLLCIATANSQECYKSCLINNGIYDYFEFVLDVTSFDCGKEKPDIYISAANRLGLKVCECAVFEDLLLALNTAKKAGFVSVGVYESSCKDEKEKKEIADLYINSYKELL